MRVPKHSRAGAIRALRVAMSIRSSIFSMASNRPFNSIKVVLSITAVLFLCLAPRMSWACACGCGIYEVGTASLFPAGMGGTVWVEYDYLDQYLNWHATQIASANHNDDKVLRSQFITLGGQYMFNRSWGVMVEVPYTVRYFKGADEDTGAIGKFNHANFGDVRVSGMYTGLSEDMSTGLSLGLKLPSGDYTYPHFDRDTEIGTGSTDIDFGAYHLGTLPWTFKERPFNWFVQGYYQLPVFTQGGYKPGREFDGALGTYYNIGKVAFLKELAPMLTLLGTDRVRDSLSQADPRNTGYDRIFIAPGAEVRVGILRIYGDVEVPVFQNMNGNQITPAVTYKTVVSYDF
jgi:hypothetical protein